MSFEIFEALATQLRFIGDSVHKDLIEKTGKSQISSSSSDGSRGDVDANFDFYDAIFNGDGDNENDVGDDDGRRGRSRSPNNRQSVSSKVRVSQSSGPPVLTKARSFMGGGSGGSRDGKLSQGNQGESGDDDRNRLRSTSLGLRSRSSRKYSNIANGNSLIGGSAGAGGNKKAGSGKREGVRVVSKLMKGEKSPKRGEANAGSSAGEDNDVDEDEDLEIISRIFRDTPPEVSRLIRFAKGHVYGVWLSEAHPLSLHSNNHCNMICFIKEGAHYANASTNSNAGNSSTTEKDKDGNALVASGGSAPVPANPATTTSSTGSSSKKFEWQLDLMRDWDDKRFMKFEAFLVSQRQANANVPLYTPSNGNYYNHMGRSLALVYAFEHPYDAFCIK